MARLLIVSTNYAPEVTGTGPYVAAVAEFLAAEGHHVDVVAGLPHYPEWKIKAGIPRVLRRTEFVRGVTVHRRAHYVPAHPSAARRAVLEGTFLIQGMVGFPRADAVIGVVPGLADAVLARTIASLQGVPYGLVFQDLMGRAAQQSGTSGGDRVAAVIRRGEAWVLARASLVGIITPSFAPYLESLGVPPDRLVTLRNWSRTRGTPAPRHTTRARLGWDDELIVLHAGNMGMKQGLEQVVAAAVLAAERGIAIRFVLVGDGNQREHISSLAAGVRTVEMRPLVSEHELTDLLAAADILLVSERSSLIDMSLPSKLTTYLAAGRPIVAAIPPTGVTADEVRRSGGGVVVAAGDPELLIQQLKDLATDQPARDRLVRDGQAFARGELGEDTSLRRYRAFVDALVGAGGRA